MAERWSTIKRGLAAASSTELLNLVRDLYQASPENRRFLHARLTPQPAIVEGYRQRVVEAVFPDPLGKKQVRVGEAERLIRHFRRATSDLASVTDLTLSFVEAGTEHAANLGYGDEKYFNALVRALESVVEALPSLPSDARVGIEGRLQEVQETASELGWGYPDAVREIIASATSGPTRG